MAELIIIAEKCLPEISALVVRRSLNYVKLFEGRFSKIHYVSAFDLTKVEQEIDVPDEIQWHQLFVWRRKNRFAMLLSHVWFYIKIFWYSYHLLKNNKQIQIISHPYGHYAIGLVVVLLAKATSRISLVRIAEERSAYTAGQDKPKSILSNVVSNLLIGVEKYVLEHADWIISVSPLFLNQERTKIYTGKTEVIPNIFPILEHFESYEEKKDTDRINSSQRMIKALFVGRLSPVKGIYTLIDAIALTPCVYCRIIGDGPLADTLKEQVRNLGLADRISFSGVLSQTEVWERIQEADVLLLPSLSEYTPNVIIEAGVLEVPTIASNIGGIPYMIEPLKTGLLFEVNDSHSLASKLEWIQRNPQQYHSMRTAVRIHTYQKYNSETLTTKANLFLDRIFATGNMS